MVIKKEKLTIYIMRFDNKQITIRLKISEEEGINAFRDGRTASNFTEIWSSKIFHEKRKNAKGFDLDDGSSHSKTSVKCITNHTTVHFSKNTGYNRKCEPEDVKEALRKVNAYIFVDINDYPNRVVFIKLPSSVLYEWWDKGYLSYRSGNISRKKFLEKLYEYYEVQEEYYE